MDRQRASKLTRELLDKYNLNEWGVRLTTDINQPFLGMCVHKDKVIILNAHHIDIHPDVEVIDTIRHEVAHCLTPGHGHDEVWQAKAKELGASPLPCSHLSFPAHIIDAIRSGATIEVTVEEEHHVIRRPKYNVTRLQDKCPDCGKVAVEKFNVEMLDREGNTIRLITLDCFHIIKKIIPRGTPFENMVSNDWKDEIKSCKHEWPTKAEAKELEIQTNQCKKCREFKLYNFQVVGAKFAESALAIQKGAGIFDDMGLGKTVQGLAVLKFHPEYTPTLYITKSKLKFQWFKEIVRWLGPTYMGQIISTSKDFVYPGLKSYIIPYDLLRRFPREKLTKLGIKLVILDECQQIKNPDSSRTQEVRKILADPSIKVIPLSGTPWKNRGEEFFPVLNMLSPTKFHSHQAYLDNWVQYYYEGNKRKMGGIKNIPKFREYVQDIIIRREFTEVMDEYPETPRMKLNVQLDDLNQSTYNDATSEFVQWYNQLVIDGTEDQINSIELLGRMSRMRHITGLAKIPATVGFVEEFIEDTDRKLTIFVHHKDVAELLLAEIKKISGHIPVYSLPGNMNDADSYHIQELFNGASRAILVASTLANGEGVNLQTCADAIMHERQWNPQNEDQASPGRFRRIGQKSSVINTTFVEAEGTIDEHIDYLVENKRKAFHEVMNKSVMQTWDEGSFAKELAGRIVAKHKERNKDKPKTNITQMASFA